MAAITQTQTFFVPTIYGTTIYGIPEYYPVPTKPSNLFVVGIIDKFGTLLSSLTVRAGRSGQCRFSLIIRFRGEMPKKELQLLKKIKKFFKCGKVVIPKNKNHMPYFEVNKLDDLKNNVVPFFKK